MKAMYSQILIGKVYILTYLKEQVALFIKANAKLYCRL